MTCDIKDGKGTVHLICPGQRASVILANNHEAVIEGRKKGFWVIEQMPPKSNIIEKRYGVGKQYSIQSLQLADGLIAVALSL